MTIASEWIKRRGFLMQVQLASGQFNRGERLVGVARLRSTAAREVQAGEVKVSLFTMRSDGASELALEEPLFERRPLAPSQEVEHPFWIPLPAVGALGTHRVMLTSGGGIFQYLLAPVVTVQIAPERRLSDLVKLLAEIARHEVTLWHLAGGGDGFHVELSPRAELADRMLGIGVELYPSGKGVYGNIAVMPRDHGAFQAYGVTHTHRFRLQNTEPETARRAFEPLLLPFVNSLRELPIPAQATPSAEGLPLPAAENSSLE